MATLRPASRKEVRAPHCSTILAQCSQVSRIISPNNSLVVVDHQLTSAAAAAVMTPTAVMTAVMTPTRHARPQTALHHFGRVESDN